MVGSRIVELLAGKYDFEDLSLENGGDITDRQMVLKKIREFAGEWIFHLAAKTDVDSCEKDKELKEDGATWRINVFGTKNLVDGCAASGKKILYISTDFVFDGENPPSGGYSEKDTPNPINWYGQTKYEGEKIVQRNAGNWIICRLAFPYRANFAPKKDFLRAILSRIKNGEKIQAVSDQIITPTYIDNLAFALDELLRYGIRGIYHVVGSQFLSPYEVAKLIARAFHCDENLIGKVKREDYYLGRAKRPFKMAIKNDKITKLGIRMCSFKDGLNEIKEQMVYQ